jgi:hypothetical protein
MARYDIGSISRLAEFVGYNNVGVKYRFDWISKVVVEVWVTNEKEKQPNQMMRSVLSMLTSGVCKQLT